MTSKNKILMEKAKKMAGVNDEEYIISKALKLFVDKFEHPNKRNKSFYELSKDIAGCIEGPKDLSSNKKYLENFGCE